MQKATPQKVPRWKPARIRSQKLPEVLLEPEPGMSPERFQKCLDLLRLSQRGLAPLLDCSERLPASWANGRPGWLRAPETAETPSVIVVGGGGMVGVVPWVLRIGCPDGSISLAVTNTIKLRLK